MSCRPSSRPVDNLIDNLKRGLYIEQYMGLTPKDRKAGGQAVLEKYGTEYMRKLGKKGRKKQLEVKEIHGEDTAKQ